MLLLEALSMIAQPLTPRLEIGDQTWVSATTAQTRVRGGGAAGGRAWLALVTGSDPRWGVARTFVDALRSTSQSGRSGSMFWDVPADARLLEYRGFATSSRHCDSAFTLVLGGKVARLTRAKALALVASGARAADFADIDALAAGWTGTVAALAQALAVLRVGPEMAVEGVGRFATTGEDDVVRS